jgi:hypothetical protein
MYPNVIYHCDHIWRLPTLQSSACRQRIYSTASKNGCCRQPILVHDFNAYKYHHEHIWMLHSFHSSACHQRVCSTASEYRCCRRPILVHERKYKYVPSRAFMDVAYTPFPGCPLIAHHDIWASMWWWWQTLHDIWACVWWWWQILHSPDVR